MARACGWMVWAAAVTILAACPAQGADDLAPLLPRPVEKTAFPGYTPARAAKGAFEIPLAVEEQWGQGGPRYVTCGVPLLPGQAKDVKDLRLVVTGADGKRVAVPAQFRVLARWWRADNSIRWVLVDVATDVGGSQTKTFLLTTKTPDVSETSDVSPLSVRQTDDAITVTTGPAQFVIDRRRFTFLKHARLDANKDGAFTDDEDLLATDSGHGTVIEDTFGETYTGGAGTASVDVIEAGPVRVRVRARGVHRAAEGRGFSKGMYQFDVFLDFYAGSTDVKADVVLANNFTTSHGAPTFEDASLLMKLAGGATGFRLYGEAPLDGRLGAGESYLMLQDSNGAETWRVAQGHFGPSTSSFRGYRVLGRHKPGFTVERVRPAAYEYVQLKEDKEATVTEEIVTQGGQARGLAHFYNDRGGLIVHTQRFWEQFPKGVEVFADGTLRLALFPREYKAPHYFEDASGKGHVAILHFYDRKQKNRYAADGAKRTWPHVFADCWDYPVFLRPPMAHMAACGALTDVGPFTPPTRGFQSWPMEIHYRRMLMTDRYWGNGFGWQVFGSRWQAHGGHSSRGARQPIKEDAWLYKWYVTGHREWLVYGENRSRHFRDVRCYRIEGQDPFGFKSWDAFRKVNRSEDWTGRPQPKDEETSKYSQGAWRRSTWWLPNPAHMTLDLLYDRSLLFGDQRALENMRIIAGHGGNFSGYYRPYVHRQTGWSWRALERYWELTGDAGAEQCLMDTLKNYEPLIGKTPLVCGKGTKVNWWFTQVFSRAVAMTALHTRDKRAIDLCKTLAVGKESRAGYYCTLFAVLYHLTGEATYKQAVLDSTKGGDTLLTVNTNGDFPATAHWLLNQPPNADPN